MNEPTLKHIGFYAAPSQEYGSPGWVVIAWPSQESMGRVIGPFRNQTEARAYGRKHYPYKHKVAGMHAARTTP